LGVVLSTSHAESKLNFSELGKDDRANQNKLTVYLTTAKEGMLSLCR